MDQIVKADVDEEQIAPFMQDISRYFEYIDKEDLIKKIVSMEFGRFLAYYADAPEIETVSSKKEERGRDKKGNSKGKKGATPTSAGMRKLFINLGKKDGFYPGELMQFLNKNVRGHVEVGHIDLLSTMSYFEVPEEDAQRVIKFVNGQRYKNRDVRCNDAEEGGHPQKETKGGNRSSRANRNDKANRANKTGETYKSKKANKKGETSKTTFTKEEWMQFLHPKSTELKGDVPDFSEEGWALRRPKKKS